METAEERTTDIRYIKVSVVVATYRRDEGLTNALSSLAAQTFKNIEIVLVDDNGDDKWNTVVVNIVQRFSRSNPAVVLRYICNNTNQGAAKTRNIGIEAADGEYITFLDDDDVYMPEKIEGQLNYMLREDADYSITDLDLYDQNNVLQEHKTRKYITSVQHENLIRYHLMYHMTGTDTMMFKKDYLLKIGSFDSIDVGDEFYLMLKAVNGNGKFCYYPACDVNAYIHTGDSGLSSGAGKIDGENRLFRYKEKYFAQLRKSDIRYIRMRHFAVLAFAYLRMKKYASFISNALRAFITTPVGCVKLFCGRKG